MKLSQYKLEKANIQLWAWRVHHKAWLPPKPSVDPIREHAQAQVENMRTLAEAVAKYPAIAARVADYMEALYMASNGNHDFSEIVGTIRSMAARTTAQRTMECMQLGNSRQCDEV